MYCDIAFTVEPTATLEDWLNINRQLFDYCDVEIEDDMEIGYDDNGSNPVIYVTGNMPDDKEHWDRL